MIIIGIDPGTTNTGYGIIEVDKKRDLTLIDYGCVVTEISSPAERLSVINQAILKLLKKHKPNLLALEDLFFFKNQKSIIKVGQAQGAIMLTASIDKIPVVMYTPLQVKQAVSGYGRAEKQQIQQMVKIILRLKELPQPGHAADALAVAICAGQCFEHPLSTRS